MSDRNMVETVFQGKTVKRSLLSNYNARQILLYAFYMAAVTDGSKTIEELYRRLGMDDNEESLQADDEYEDCADSWTVVDLDARNIYIDCYSNSAKANSSRPIIPMDTLLDIMIQRPGEDSISFWNRCQIENYKGFRCPFDMFSSERLLKYVRKHCGWEIPGEVYKPAPDPDASDTVQAEYRKPGWLLYWEEQREGIGMPEISEECALGKYQFTIYELFLMGIAFETDAETISFVSMLNQTLKRDIDKYIEEWGEEATDLCRIFKYQRDITAQERQELHKKSLNSLDVITIDLKNIIKRSICSWREEIPCILRNSRMDALAERISVFCRIRRNVQRELCIWTMGELEAADLSKCKCISPEEISEIQNDLMWYHARPYWEAHPELDEAMKEWRKKQPIALEDYAIDDLELSLRVYNCLKRAQINSLADLAAMAWDELLQIRNLREKDANEIWESVKEFGINFGRD